MITKDLRDAATHFRFGENWANFATKIDDRAIDEAFVALKRLCGQNELTGLTFLDIGCGSGLHRVAALKLGAKKVVAIDLDVDSVTTTENTLRRFAPPESSYAVLQSSVFEFCTIDIDQYDIVYSWGVLHHTGSMREAIKLSAERVRPGGLLCIALYGKTALCGFWKFEKRFYKSASPSLQGWIRRGYLMWFWAISSLAQLRHGQQFNLETAIEKYNQRRGMQFWTDVHDWLGGYPYESIAPSDVNVLMERLGFSEELCFLVPGRRLGLLGSGCDEYRFVRRST